MLEIALDVAEGADAILVKPALPSLDILARAHDRFDLPIGAYQVSGEYASIAAAAQNGWLDRRRALLESTTSIVRAGASFVITYAAAEIAEWLREDPR
jgi:porphobilinogen synthase